MLIFLNTIKFDANIAQLVEHSPDKGKVTGSIPVIRTTPVEQVFD